MDQHEMKEHFSSIKDFISSRFSTYFLIGHLIIVFTHFVINYVSESTYKSASLHAYEAKKEELKNIWRSLNLLSIALGKEALIP